MSSGSGGGGAIIGAAIGAGSAAASAKAVAKLNRKNRQFAEYQRTTAFQVQRADLEAAGLNPILGIAGGATGARSVGYQTTPPDPGRGIADATAKGVDAALTTKKNNPEIKLLRNSAAKARDDGLLAREKGNTEVTQQKLNAIAGKKITQETRNMHLEEAILTAERAAAASAYQIDKSLPGKAMRWIDRLGTSINPFIRSGGGRRRK